MGTCSGSHRCAVRRTSHAHRPGKLANRRATVLARAATKRISETHNGTTVEHTVDEAGKWLATQPQKGNTSERIVERLQAIFLPRGYPATTTPDYLTYQLWAMPVHVTGWIASSIVTSSLLKAAGLGTGAAGTVAAGAAIKWITKDGIGALGRFVVGGSLARYFDEDPRFWRFWGDMVATLGYLLEIGTAAVPSMFLLLAGLGNFTKAAGKGIGRPAFRVIQNHFAREANVGDIAAKEEVWEVSAQLLGLAASVAVLETMQTQDVDSATMVVGAWALFQGVHIVLRFISLGKLQLPWLSQQRLQLLAEDYVAGEALETVSALCARESFAVPKQLLSGAVQTNASVAQLEEAANFVDVVSVLHGQPQRQPSSEALYAHLRHVAAMDGGTTGVAAASPSETEGSAATDSRQRDRDASTTGTDTDQLQAALRLFEWEQYVLLPAPPPLEPAQVLDTGARQRGGLWSASGVGPAFVMGITEKAVAVDLLKGMLHAAKCRQLLREGGAKDVQHRSRALVQSFDFAERNIDAFRDQLEGAGWDVHTVLMASQQTHLLRVEDANVRLPQEATSV